MDSGATRNTPVVVAVDADMLRELLTDGVLAIQSEHDEWVARGRAPQIAEAMRRANQFLAWIDAQPPGPILLEVYPQKLYHNGVPLE